MNESIKIILTMLFTLLCHSGFLFLQDTNPTRKKRLNIFLLVVLVWLWGPLLLSAIISFGGNPYSEASGGGALLWLYMIVAPTGAIAYLVLLVLKIVYATKAKQVAKNWLLFAGIYLFIPLLVSIASSLIEEAKPRGPYAGYNSMSVAISEEYPNKLVISLTYYFPGSEQVKETKLFLVDGEYEPSSSVDEEETLSHASKHDKWYYFSETGDTLKTEFYRNDTLISTQSFTIKSAAVPAN